MRPAARTAAVAAALTLAGVVLSGPMGLALVSFHPQPAWRDAQTFVRAFHPVQTVPFLFGFLLVGGALTLIAALQALAPEPQRARATAALGFASAFAALVTFNYVAQTTFVPALVRGFRAEDGPFIAALSLSNPRSLGWGLEMWGYALLGVATWLVAPVFTGAGTVGRVTAALFVANGPLSLAAALLTALRPGWVMTGAGLAAFAAWNALVIVMLTLAIAALWRRAAPELAEA
jgi:hypothetical protein